MNKGPSIEIYQPRSSADWPEFPYGDLTITHDGSGWSGTFAVVVRAALEDVLQEGPLADVTIVEDGYTKGNRSTWRGTVESVTRFAIVFEGGSSVEMDRVLAVSF